MLSSLVWLTALSAMHVSRSEQRLLASKCCRASEELHSNLRDCRAWLNATAADDAVQEPAATLQTRSPEGLAWLSKELLSGRGAAGAIVRYGRRPDCPARLTLRLATSRDAARVKWFSNGSLALLSPTARGAAARQLFAPEDFCADTVSDGDGVRRRVFLLCPCSRVQCVSKCCPFGQVKQCDGLRCECVEHEARWQPFHMHDQLPSHAEDAAYEVLEANEPPCPNGSHLWFDNPVYRPAHVTKHWWQYPNGHLFRKNLDKCGEIVILNNTRTSYSTIGYCYLSLPFDAFFEVGSMLHVPAALLLAVTVIVLAYTPDTKVSAYGWVHKRAMQCHTVALFVSNIILATHLVSGDETVFCRSTPITMYLSLLSAAFWLNAICINMACGFWVSKSVQMNSQKSGRRMFLFYSLYAWGASAVMTTFTAAMWYANEVPHGWMRPTLMETRRCFWEDEDGAEKMATFAYFYGPVCSLLLCNASLFVFVALRVRRLRRSSSVLRRKDSNCSAGCHYSRSALLYVRLLWLMGVAEAAVELCAWAAHHGGFYYLMAADLIDLLRAASVFALCVCNRRTLRALRGRFCACAPPPPPQQTPTHRRRSGNVELAESRAVHRASSETTVSSQLSDTAPQAHSSDCGSDSFI